MNILLITQNKTFKYYYIGDYLFFLFNTRIIFKEHYRKTKT